MLSAAHRPGPAPRRRRTMQVVLAELIAEGGAWRRSRAGPDELISDLTGGFHTGGEAPAQRAAWARCRTQRVASCVPGTDRTDPSIGAVLRGAACPVSRARRGGPGTSDMANKKRRAKRGAYSEEQGQAGAQCEDGDVSALRSRIDAIHKQLLAAHRGGNAMSSATRGSEREAFVDLLLRGCLPHPYRFGSGEVTDAYGVISGQIDLIIEYPFFPSFPLLGTSRHRLYLIEGIAIAIEIKSSCGSSRRR